MGDKKSFVLRMDADTFALIEKWAVDDFRSVNGQIEYLLHEALKKAGRKKYGKRPDSSVGKKK